MTESQIPRRQPSQDPVNKTFTAKNRPGKSKYYLDDEFYDNNNGNYGFLEPKPLTIYNPTDDTAFTEQVDQFKIAQNYKNTFIEANRTLNAQIETLNIKLGKIDEDRREIKTDLQNQTSENEYLKTIYSQKQDEVAKQRNEIDRLQLGYDKANEMADKRALELKNQTSKLVNLEVSHSKLLDEVQDLKSKKNKLNVDYVACSSEVEELKNDKQFLEDSLKLRDTSLATQLKKYEDKFKELHEDRETMHHYAKEVVQTYRTMGESQQTYQRNILITAQAVEKLTDKVDGLADRIDTMQHESVDSIDNNLKSLKEILSTGLVGEIKAAQSNRNQLNTEIKALTNEHSATSHVIKNYLAEYGHFLTRIEFINNAWWKSKLPIIFVLCIVSIFIGYIWGLKK